MLTYPDIQDLISSLGSHTISPEQAGKRINAGIEAALANPHGVDITALKGLADIAELYDYNSRQNEEPHHKSNVRLMRDLAFVRDYAGESYTAIDPLRNALEAFHHAVREIRPDNTAGLCIIRRYICNATLYCLTNNHHGLKTGQAQISISATKLLFG